MDNLKLDAANLDDRLREHHAGDTVNVLVFRDEELIRLKATLESPPADTCYLEIDEESDAQVQQMRDAWLNGD